MARSRCCLAPALFISCATGERAPVRGCHGKSSAHSGRRVHLARADVAQFGQRCIRNRRRSRDVSGRPHSRRRGAGCHVASGPRPHVRHLDGVGADDRVLGGQPATGAVIADRRVAAGILAVVKTYCPDKVPTLQKFFDPRFRHGRAYLMAPSPPPRTSLASAPGPADGPARCARRLPT